MSPTKKRCAWVNQEAIYIAYHDHEWGVPIYDDRLLFEFLILEGAQAGLSWLTILKRRDNYRLAFDHFNIKKIAKYDDKKVNELLSNTGIIRNRLKIKAAIINANKVLNLLKDFKTLSEYLWQFTDGKPLQNHWKSSKDVPATSSISDALSKDLKQRGFKFVGSTICYAFMQAVGMVNDHTTNCFRYKKLR